MGVLSDNLVGVLFCQQFQLLHQTGIVGMCYIFSTFIYKDIQSINYVNLIILSFVGSLLSVLGDLSFSLVKRTYGIKDYGNLIPGHGGVLDRFDSVVFVSPFLLISLTYLPVLA